MKDYCLKGEERFGLFGSWAYSLGIKLCGAKGFYDFVVADLDKKEFDALLDVGTGPADIPIMLVSSKKIKKIYAIDPSKDMLNIAKRKPKASIIKFGYGSSRYVPFNRKFDAIISTLSFHHWVQKIESLKYLTGFLKKGGQIRIYEFEKKTNTGLLRYFISSHAVTKKEMIDAGKEAGLKVDIVRKGGFIRTTFRQ